MLSWLSKKILKKLGWTTAYTPPPNKHGIYIVYPHTSNWDFPMGLLWKFAVRLKPRWVAKHTWFYPPVGWLMRALGGIGIKRDGNLDLTTTLKNAILKEDNCWLAIAIEGTRRHKPYIHMGYYHIAKSANIPIGVATIDYASKTVGVLHYRMVKETIEEELIQLSIEYAEVTGFYPEQMGLLKTREKKN
ncbi:1-acyl-sn-glycerol-3-phosphate acyltransferase [Hydromonas duriensis]|uniref:Acyltransferase-like protein n=1 Tax=Hydromonas duriensis TaxID=1527608 RepID=A0A4R6YBY1_9BURK|nr:1-acyl-sn-glycerol-3-phosphate acyltransferase [Hydromonas duriensis]TDR33078.1 acyltransferase-like protein [Hydromonas duriensis]